MIRGRGPDDICALCDEYSVRAADPKHAAQGKGLCQKGEQGKPLVHVDWDSGTCVSYRLDWPNLAARRQYVAIQRRARDNNTDNAEIVQ
ncbi:hypothetical protein [Massilia sp. Leaf139]|uniref:hypothetical protein n=1 Tax=Massilia sp. Leaf139 TaxID=1736272 RepID=UPI0006F54412|nr:hypothetical protein [Massilia sp. Leaf139]KQQ93641.1 hypothetical protein ASF77_22415 [Massilia sp. Leaf139]